MKLIFSIAVIVSLFACTGTTKSNANASSEIYDSKEFTTKEQLISDFTNFAIKKGLSEQKAKSFTEYLKGESDKKLSDLKFYDVILMSVEKDFEHFSDSMKLANKK